MTPLKSEIRDDMHIDWDAPIPMEDGIVLRADVFRPPNDGQYPVILAYGPYAKGLDFKEGYKSQWARLIKAVPETLEGSTNKYQNWCYIISRLHNHCRCNNWQKCVSQCRKCSV